MDLSSKALPNFKEMNGVDAKIYGSHNKVLSVNPYKCKFTATYPDGKEIKGNDLFSTGWDKLPQGLSKLRYELSTGHVIEIPKFKGYLNLIEVSFGMDGSKIFHFINESYRKIPTPDYTSVAKNRKKSYTFSTPVLHQRRNYPTPASS